MSIRLHVKRRLVLCFIGAFGAWLLLAFAMLTSKEAPPAPLMFVGMGVFIGVILFLNFGIRCPRCGGNLGITIAPAMLAFFAGKRRISFCPYCGVSLDESLDAAQQIAAADRGDKQRPG